MHLSWFGLSSFKIETKDAVLVTDPFAPAYAKKLVRAKADIVTISQADDPLRNYLGGLQGEPFVIDHAGEFEVKNIFLQGLSSTDAKRNSATPDADMHGRAAAVATNGVQTTVFTFDVEDMRLAHLGNMSHRLTGEVLERLSGVDVLFVPVGGGTVLDAEAAAAIVNDIEPRVVIPMHFNHDGLAASVGKLAPVAGFLKEMGASAVTPVDRLLLKKRDLPTEEETRVHVFRVA